VSKALPTFHPDEFSRWFWDVLPGLGHIPIRHRIYCDRSSARSRAAGLPIRPPMRAGAADRADAAAIHGLFLREVSARSPHQLPQHVLWTPAPPFNSAVASATELRHSAGLTVSGSAAPFRAVGATLGHVIQVIALRTRQKSWPTLITSRPEKTLEPLGRPKRRGQLLNEAPAP